MTHCPSSLGGPLSRWAGALLLAAGCGGAWPRVLDPSDVVDLREGRPRVSAVRDLGGIHIGGAGPLLAESDGRFTVGELVLIEGSGFGRQPTVSIGGRPTEVLFRTRGGGAIVRLPTGGRAGLLPATVEASGGRGEAPIEVRRLALLLDRRHGQVHTLELEGGPGQAAEARHVGQPLSLPKPRELAMAADGAAGYVLLDGGDHGRVAILDLSARGQPKLAEIRELTHPAYALVTAERGAVLAAVGPQHVTIWDLRESRRPTPWSAARLPDEAAGGRMAALDPGGTVLAVGLPTGNRALLIDVKPGQRRVQPALLAQAEVLPGARQPLLTGLRFAGDGATLWALLGDNPASIGAGHQVTRLCALRVGVPEDSTEVGAQKRELTVDRTVELPDAGAPVRLALSRAAPVASGATIRTPPERTAIYLTAAVAAGMGGAKGKKTESGSLLRADLSGGMKIVFGGAELLGGVDLTPDGAIAVTSVSGSGPQGLVALFAHTESEATLTVSLGPSSEADQAPPWPPTEVAVQP